jgi:hypothetical protein
MPPGVAGVAAADGAFVGAPELGERGRLPGAGGAGDHQAAEGGDRVGVELDQQPTGGQELADRRAFTVGSAEW